MEEHTEYQHLRAQVLDLGGMLGHLLKGDALDAWLRIEAAFNDQRAITAETYYNAGVDAGLAMRVVAEAFEAVSSEPAVNPAAGVRALAAAIMRLAERM